LDVSVTRGAIVVPSVAGEMLDDGIAYVQLFTFGEKTADDLHNTLTTLLDQNPKGLILDLRNNGGGYLETAIDVSSEFIDQGVVMYEVYGDGREDVFNSKGNGIATKIPLVVLINEGSASASEIVAGAVQDRERGYLVGVTSYGKGSVQTVSQLSDNEGAVRVTVARWLTPNRRQIAKIGLTPDFMIDFTEQDVANGTDVRLNQATEVLLKGLTPPPIPLPTRTPVLTPTP
jgi:carboxyl-terminal processing protease